MSPVWVDTTHYSQFPHIHNGSYLKSIKKVQADMLAPPMKHVQTEEEGAGLAYGHHS